jgi:hypothetical protein
MKRWVSFYEIPEMLPLMTRFQRQFIMKAKAGRHLAAMKTLFHYNHTAGNVNHFPNMCAFVLLHIFFTLENRIHYHPSLLFVACAQSHLSTVL